MPTLTGQALIDDKKKAVEMLVALMEALEEYQAEKPSSYEQYNGLRLLWGMAKNRTGSSTSSAKKQEIISETLDKIYGLISLNGATEGCTLGCIHTRTRADDGSPLVEPARYQPKYDQQKDISNRSMCQKIGYSKKGSEYFAEDDYMLTPNVINDTGDERWTDKRAPSKVAQELCDNVVAKLRAARSSLVKDMPESTYMDDDDVLVTVPGRLSLQNTVEAAAAFDKRHPKTSSPSPT
jgi:hypothetical protein